MAAGLNRRDFCAGLCSMAALSSCRCRPPAESTIPEGGSPPPKEMSVETFGEGTQRVVEVRWAEAVDGNGRVNDQAVRAMVTAGATALGADTFEALAGAKRRASIKVNSITSQAFTHPELAAAVARSLVDAGSVSSNVTVWDRDTAGLTARGYSIDAAGKQGYRCVGTDGISHDGKRRSITVIDNKVYLSPLLTEADVLISIAALKDHSMAGVTLALKNNFGMITGAERLHGNVSKGSACEPGISELAATPDIADRLQLAIIDGLVGVCEGGPGTAAPGHVWRRASLLLSSNPVALDRRGLAIIEQRRDELGLEPLGERTSPNPSPPVHIDNAAERLG